MFVENERRAELLCFLVVTAAASHSLTSEWRVDHVSKVVGYGSGETLRRCRGLSESTWDNSHFDSRNATCSKLRW